MLIAGAVATVTWIPAAQAGTVGGTPPASESGILNQAIDTLRGLGLPVGDDAPEFLRPDQAFAVDVRAAGPNSVRARWTIANRYYLYRDRMKFAVKPPATLGTVNLPAGELNRDPYFGAMEVYYGGVETLLPVQPSVSGATTVDLELSFQGCADAGLCYPPITKTFTVKLGKP